MKMRPLLCCHRFRAARPQRHPRRNPWVTAPAGYLSPARTSRHGGTRPVAGGAPWSAKGPVHRAWRIAKSAACASKGCCAKPATRAVRPLRPAFWQLGPLSRTPRSLQQKPPQQQQQQQQDQQQDQQQQLRHQRRPSWHEARPQRTTGVTWQRDCEPGKQHELRPRLQRRPRRKHRLQRLLSLRRPGGQSGVLQPRPRGRTRTSCSWPTPRCSMMACLSAASVRARKWRRVTSPTRCRQTRRMQCEPKRRRCWRCCWCTGSAPKQPRQRSPSCTRRPG